MNKYNHKYTHGIECKQRERINQPKSKHVSNDIVNLEQEPDM